MLASTNGGFTLMFVRVHPGTTVVNASNTFQVGPNPPGPVTVSKPGFCTRFAADAPQVGATIGNGVSFTMNGDALIGVDVGGGAVTTGLGVGLGVGGALALGVGRGVGDGEGVESGVRVGVGVGDGVGLSVALAVALGEGDGEGDGLLEGIAIEGDGEGVRNAGPSGEPGVGLGSAALARPEAESASTSTTRMGGTKAALTRAL